MTDIREQYDSYIMPTYARQPVTFVRGEGCYLYDGDGNAYLDFVTGLSVNNLGHCHPAVVEAVRRQAGELSHVSNLYYTAPGGELAELVTANSIGGKVFFSNSGAEANECAIKLARKHGRDTGGDGKTEIITLEGGFHGRTMATLTATAQPQKQEPFRPLLPGFTYVARNDSDALRAAAGDNVCALVMEPVQGEGGVHPLEQGFVEAARELADEHGALLIFDEVQTGMGRTGRLFAHEHFGVKPDVMTLAKSLGGGLPIGATVAAPPYADVLDAGLHGSTFGGGPVACAAGVAVFRQLLEPGFLERATALGGYLQDGLQSLVDSGLAREVRGLGLMLALEMKEPVAGDMVSRALEEGIILNNTSAETVRFLPPLTADEGMMDRVVEFLRTALEDEG
jgi:predicted acetylornithine/succinylornithine family transaminase